VLFNHGAMLGSLDGVVDSVPADEPGIENKAAKNGLQRFRSSLPRTNTGRRIRGHHESQLQGTSSVVVWFEHVERHRPAGAAVWLGTDVGHHSSKARKSKRRSGASIGSRDLDSMAVILPNPKYTR